MDKRCDSLKVQGAYQELEELLILSILGPNESALSIRSTRRTKKAQIIEFPFPKNMNDWVGHTYSVTLMSDKHALSADSPPATAFAASLKR